MLHQEQNSEVISLLLEVILNAFILTNCLFSELHLLREMVMHKFGREFSLAVMENRDGCVPTRVRNEPI